MSQRTLLIIFAVITVVAFAALRFASKAIGQMEGLWWLITLLAIFLVGAIAAPYLDRSRRDGLD